MAGPELRGFSMIIDIPRDFSKTPGPRYREQGHGSGQAFREEHLVPTFEAARTAGERLTVRLDGVKYGYPTSFLEEAFGGLARIVGIEVVQQTLIFESEAEPMLEEEIRHYISHANETVPMIFDPKGLLNQ